MFIPRLWYLELENDLPYSDNLELFGGDYLCLTKQVADSCTDHDLSANSMVIGTSALLQYEIDGLKA